MIWIAFIALCSLLGHLGGQSKTIPDPRITCRVFGIGLAFGVLAIMSGYSPYLILVALPGMAIPVIPANGEEFNALKGHTDSHGTNGYQWIYWICSKVLNIPIVGVITNAQSRAWGTLYGCILGLFQMPMFMIFSYLLTPWAIPLGFLGAAQGLIYRWSPSVLVAEWINFAWIGMRLAAVLMLSGAGI